MSLMVALRTALQSLLSHQAALMVTAHNTANAQNPTYSRQVARLQAAPLPWPLPEGGDGEGTGVRVAEIGRQHDALLEALLRTNGSRVAYWKTLREGLERVEEGVQEPSAGSLAASLTAFFQAWRDVASEPGNEGGRATLLEQAQSLLEQASALRKHLLQEQRLVVLQAEQEVEELNRLLAQVAQRNGEIAAAQAAGSWPNDGLDARDALLRGIAERLSIQVHPQPNGTVLVMAAGQELVAGTRPRTVRLLREGEGALQFVLEDTGEPLQVGEGRLGALRDLAREALAEFAQGLERWLEGLLRTVNALHTRGYGLEGSTGLPFFVQEGQEWRVNPELWAQPERIAASETGAPGDGRIAAAIGRLAEEEPGPLQGYTAWVGRVAGRVRAARTTAEALEEVHRSLSNRRDALSGVSLDEEMVDLMRFQQAYTAAARVLQAVDQLLSTLLQRL